MNHTLIERKYETPLGIVVCGLISDGSKINFIENKTYENGQSKVYETKSHFIELIEFKIRIPLYNGMSVTDSQGWIWRITKLREDSETIQLYCKLENVESQIEFDTTSGESLDAIEASNSHWVLHIGTEDGEIMNFRAKNNDWFPERLQNKVDFYKSITEMQTNGFQTKLPDLRINEKLHVHYICAYDKNTKDQDFVNTWFAVDEFKRKLENWIGVF